MSAGTSPPASPSKLQSIFNSFTHGIIFLCNDQTKDECLQRMLFGSPSKRKDFVERCVTPQCALFLFKMSNKADEPQMHGLFVPEGLPAMNIVPDAWAGCGSFPMQLRVRYHYKFPRPLSWGNFQLFFKGRNISQSPTRSFIPCEKPIPKAQLNRLLAHYLYQTFDTLTKGSPDWNFCLKYGKTIDNITRGANGNPIQKVTMLNTRRPVAGRKGLLTGKSTWVSSKSIQKTKLPSQCWDVKEPPQQFTILPKPKIEEPPKPEPEKPAEPVKSEPKSAILRAVIKNSASREQSERERGLRNWNIHSNRETVEVGEESENSEIGEGEGEGESSSPSPVPVPKFSILPRPGGAKPAVAIPPPPERKPYSARKSTERAVILDKYQEKPHKRSQQPSRSKSSQQPSNQKSWLNQKPDTHHQVLRFSVGQAPQMGKPKHHGMQQSMVSHPQGQQLGSKPQHLQHHEPYNPRRPPMTSHLQQHQVDNKVLGQTHENVVRQWQGMGGMNHLSNQLAAQRLNAHPQTKRVETLMPGQGQVQSVRQQLGPSVQLSNQIFKAPNYEEMNNNASAAAWTQGNPAMRQQQPLYQTSQPVAYQQNPHQPNYQQMGVGQAMGPMTIPGMMAPTPQTQKRLYQQSTVGGTIGTVPMGMLPTTTYQAPNPQTGPGGPHKQYTVNVSPPKPLKAQYQHQQHGMYGNEQHLAAPGNISANTIDSPFNLPQLGMWTQNNTAELRHQGSWSGDKTNAMLDGRSNNPRSFLASHPPRPEQDTFAPYASEIMEVSSEHFQNDPNKNYG